MSRATLVSQASALALAGGAFLLATAAAAQPRSTEVQEVIVTAEPRAQALQTAPVAATVLSGADLERQSIHSVDDLEFSTPSLTVSSTGQGNAMNIRGIGKNSIAGNTTSAVATYRDGIGTISGFFNSEPYFDVASVEVLRGPQGTFVGQNAAGGAIFVNTRDAVLGRWDGYIQAGIGNYNTREIEGAVSMPFGDTFAARLSFRHTERDSFFDVFTDAAATQRHPQDVGAQYYNSVRLSLLYQPLESLSFRLKIDASDLNNNGYAFGVVPGWPGGGANISNDLFVVGNNYFDNYARDRLIRGALDIRYTFPNGIVLRSLSGAQWINTYIRNDDDGSLTFTRSQHINATFRIFSEEVTLVSPDAGRFRWIAGAYWNEEILVFPFNDGFVGTTNNIATVQILWRTPRRTAAVFGQVSYDLTDRLEVQAGLRYNHYSVSQDVIIGFPTLDCAVALCKVNNHTEDRVTGKIALNYTANENHFFYGFVATGVTTGGVNLVPGVPNYLPTTVTSYEVGWRGRFLGGQIRTQLDYFYNNIHDYQIAYTIPPPINRTAYQNLTEDSYIQGVEFTAQGRLANWGFDIAVAWLDSALGNQVIRDTLTATDINIDGHPHPFTPNWTFRAGIEYSFDLGNDATLTPRIDYAWTDVQTVGPLDRLNAGLPIDRIFAHDQVNAQLVWERHDWRVTAYLTNATNEAYIEGHGGPGSNAYPNEPRRFGVRVNRNF